MPIHDESQHQIVSDAVAAAESATSGEIVTVVAQASDGYTDVALVWAIAIAFTAMSVFAVIPDFYTGLWDAVFHAGWAGQWTHGEVLTLAIGFGLLTFAGVMALMLWRPLRMALVPAPVKRLRVRRAAVRHFKVGAERRTHGRTGVLIYLSMDEHRAEIVADDAIAAIVSADVWGVAMADMLAEIRKGCVAEGIAAGVRDVGAVLAEHFPRDGNDVNELPDRLIVL
ncbi:TPM domain-containing protein [Alteraurantiacibacter palmitatis]|uniref:TPM domain-containing protein n=1 Tax=Alteraurantiacibacter palmitatis TaxID=2054628 RepID=A0ABV7E6D7_9SPHN